MVCVLAVAGDTAPVVLATGVPADAIGKRMVDRRPIGDAGQGTHMRRRAAVAGREPDEGRRRADGGGGGRNKGHHRRVVYATEKIVKKGPGIW